MAQDGVNNKIRVLQRRAYGYRDEEYLKLKIVAAFFRHYTEMQFSTHTNPRRPKTLIYLAQKVVAMTRQPRPSSHLDGNLLHSADP